MRRRNVYIYIYGSTSERKSESLRWSGCDTCQIRLTRSMRRVRFHLAVVKIREKEREKTLAISMSIIIIINDRILSTNEKFIGLEGIVESLTELARWKRTSNPVSGIREAFQARLHWTRYISKCKYMNDAMDMNAAKFTRRIWYTRRVWTYDKT